MKKNKIKFRELRNKTIEIKNSADKINSRLDTAEENISELKDGSEGIIQNAYQNPPTQKYKRIREKEKEDKVQISTIYFFNQESQKDG